MCGRQLLPETNLQTPRKSRKMTSDILFTAVETFNGIRPWGRFLDSGTGVHSLKWIQKQETTGWTAITADNQMKNQIIAERDIHIR